MLLSILYLQRPFYWYLWRVFLKLSPIAGNTTPKLILHAFAVFSPTQVTKVISKVENLFDSFCASTW